MPTWGYAYWPIFLIAVSVAFLTPEGYALVTNTANTLSYYAWHMLHVPTKGQAWPHTAAWLLSQGAYIVVAYWLWRHIWYHQYT